MLETYVERAERFRADQQKLESAYNRASNIRLLSFILLVASIIQFLRMIDPFWLLPIFLMLVITIRVMKYHSDINLKRLTALALVELNKAEAAYLESGELRFFDGSEFRSDHHFYAGDLDIFGPRSLFQHINRTGTYLGRRRLAHRFLNRLENDDIRLTQEAIQELGPMLDWRQHFTALGLIQPDMASQFQAVNDWLTTNESPTPKWLSTLATVLPVGVFLSSLIVYLIGDVTLVIIPSVIVIMNVLLVMIRSKHIQAASVQSDRMEPIFKQYAKMLAMIEATPFESELLTRLKTSVKDELATVQQALTDFGNRLAAIQSINNGLGALIMNGLFAYHIHALRRLSQWKSRFGAELPKWFNLIGDVDVINSLANLHYNNPEFCFPEINEDARIRFDELGHPMISPTKRITNSISFESQRFIVLTGSNMSGKSTFLRSLGINMILSGMGSVICAKSATVSPMDVIASMRISDSVADDESFFYAEVKRLKQIMDRLQQGPAFVILDEILRGTNSDDKHSGTVTVLKRMVELKAIGAMATHDLAICDVTGDYPDELVNKCFESEVVDGELKFDYMIRDGVCRNRNATFLLQSHGII